MYLSRVYIQNYRSISELEISFSPGKNVLVGRNNAGKSNIIKAINLVLGEFSPDYKKSDNITLDDFHSTQGNVTEQILIWCELARVDNELLDYENFYGSCSGYSIAKDRFPINSYPNDIPNALSLIREKGSPWIDAKDIGKGALNRALEPMNHFAYAFIAWRRGQEISKDLRLFYRENESSNWIMAFYAPFRNELIQSALIPSFRDPQNQLRINSWSWYGKLLKAITKETQFEDELKQAMYGLQEISNKIFSDVGTKVTSSSVKTAFPGTELLFQLNTDTQADLYKSCVIYVDDGFKSQLTEKGAGIQSAVIVGLFSYYMREINTIGSALLCIEEPELYLHPHGRRVMNNNLETFLDDDRNQVILSTHSAEFINTPGDAKIVLVRKDNCKTTARCVNTKDFKRLLLSNDQNELFFADTVIVCEGYDAYILRWIADFLFPGKLDEQNVSVISVEGKDNFGKICKQLVDLQIDCYVLADFDFLLRDKSSDREIYKSNSHENILSLTQRFFCQESVFGDEGRKVYGKIEKLRNTLKLNDPKSFFTAKKVNEISDKEQHENIMELLQNLQAHGLCILSGEIENVCRNLNGKLDLDAVYNIKNQIDNGATLSELFNSKEITNFLCHVLNIGGVDSAVPYENDTYYVNDAELLHEDDIEEYSQWENCDFGDDDTPF
jgi:predicted ATP-dependent endonuclease of OLD family